MIKKIINSLISFVKNIGVIIFSFLGFSFTKTETKEKSELEENDESDEGSTKTVVLPVYKDEEDKTLSFVSHEISNKKEIKENLKQKYNELKYDYLGITIYNDEDLNIIISKVEKNSFADKFGLEEGDLLLEINDIKINEQKTFAFIQQMQKFENENMKITFIRNKKELEVELLLEKQLNNDEIISFTKEELPKEPLMDETVDIKNVIIDENTNNNEILKREENVCDSEKTAEIEKVIPQTIIPIVTLTNNHQEELLKETVSEEKHIQKNEKNDKKRTQKNKKAEIKDDTKKKERDEIDPKEKEALLIKKIIDEDKKEKELKISLSNSKKKTILNLLKVDNRFKMQYLPFLLFNRRMVRNMYKAHLLSNSLVSSRRMLGENIEYRNVNYKELLFKRKTTSNFIDLTFDNLYNIDMLKLELKREYGCRLESDPTLIEVMDRINYLEERTIARYQRLIEHKRELTKKNIKRKILVKK